MLSGKCTEVQQARPERRAEVDCTLICKTDGRLQVRGRDEARLHDARCVARERRAGPRDAARSSRPSPSGTVTLKLQRHAHGARREHRHLDAREGRPATRASQLRRHGTYAATTKTISPDVGSAVGVKVAAASAAGAAAAEPGRSRRLSVRYRRRLGELVAWPPQPQRSRPASLAALRLDGTPAPAPPAHSAAERAWIDNAGRFIGTPRLRHRC